MDKVVELGSDWNVLQHPLVLAGFVIFILAGLVKVMWAKDKVSGVAHERLINKVLNGAFVIAVLAIVSGLFIPASTGTVVSNVKIGNGGPAPLICMGQPDFVSAKSYDTTGKEVKGQTVAWSSLTPDIARVAFDGQVDGLLWRVMPLLRRELAMSAIQCVSG